MIHFGKPNQAATILLSLLLILACKTKVGIVDTHYLPLITPAYQVSALTLTFNQEVNAEYQKSNSKSYVPSSDLFNRYGLLVQNDTVFVLGYAQLKEGHEASEVADIADMRSNASANLYSVLLPIYRLNQFYSSKAISYFEISPKTTTTK